MPRYEFDNEKTGEIETHYVKIAELDVFKEKNTHLKQRLSKPGFADPVRIGVSKPPESWSQLLKNIKGRNLHSTIETK